MLCSETSMSAWTSLKYCPHKRIFTCNESRQLHTASSPARKLGSLHPTIHTSLAPLVVVFNFQTHAKISLFEKLCCEQSVLAFSRKGLEQKKKPDNTFSHQPICVYGDYICEQSSIQAQSPTYTLHGHTMPRHLFLCCEYKTTLTGALSALVESSRWNVYLYIQMAWCHVMSHNVSWTNNVSHFSIRPAALKPPCNLYSHSNTQAPWLQKREPCVTTVKCHSELNPRDIEVSSTSTAVQRVWGQQWQTHEHQRQVVISLF